MASARTVVKAPDVAVVGWIPRIEPESSLLPPPYAATQWPGAMGMLFGAGNPDPFIASYAHLQALVASKEFRIVVALRDIEVVWDDARNTVDLSHSGLDIVPGYTPLNWWSKNPAGAWHVKNFGYSRGAGSGSPFVLTTRNSCVVRIVARAKLTWWLNLIAATAMWFRHPPRFHSAPFAIFQIDYTIERNGRSHLRTHGSLIPSQNCYIDWRFAHMHDMTLGTTYDIAAFLTAGNCADAPLHLLRP